DDVVGSIEIDMHWDACEHCLNFDTNKEECSLGINSEDDGRIDIDQGWGEISCLEYNEGDPYEKDETVVDVDEKIQNGDVILDAPGQKFLFEGLKPMTKGDLVRMALKGEV
ncbi:MAG: hypothetical protein H7831_16250, partial [Magnetococcus sp. WYHC-3]